MHDMLGATRRTLLTSMAGAAVAPMGLTQDSHDKPNAHTQGVKKTVHTISVTDFMSPEQSANLRLMPGNVDCTDAFNAAFEHARRYGYTVHIPDGIYLVGNLIFGKQNEKGQSSAPFGLIGQSKTGTILKARPGLTGTLLKSWSIAGVTFRDFSIDTTDTHAVAWDCSWKPGVGPSTQCVIEHIIITVHDNFKDGRVAHVNWDNLNDTYPYGVTVRPGGPTSYNNCYISMVQSGGLSALSACIWTGGWMNFGCQNGEFLHCWGHGIQFAAGCLNHIQMTAGYMYANPTRQTIFWSESTAQNTGMKSFVLVATELNTDTDGIASYFDINIFSMIQLIGCEFIGRAPMLFGQQMRGDGIGPALCRITGGTFPKHMAIEDCPNGSGIEVECEGLRNAHSSRMKTKNRAGVFAPVIGGHTAPGTFTTSPASYGRWHRHGNIIHFKLRIDWSAHTAAGANVRAIVTGLPLRHETDGVEGATLEFADRNFDGARAMMVGGTIVFHKGDGQPVLLAKTGSIILSGFYAVEA